jgi:transcriptional regulator with XRE-family HTH domain
MAVSKTEQAGSGVPKDGPVVLGRRLREAREARKIGLRELAKRLELSASLISQVERGKVMPSVGTLYVIVRELDISMDDLFSDGDSAHEVAGEEGSPVQRSNARKTIYLASGVRWEQLTLDRTPELEFLHATYDAGAESCPEDALVTHEGHEYGYVLSGRLMVTIGNDTFELKEGDSVSFASNEPHRLFNVTDDQAETVWLVTGRKEDARLTI